MSQKLEQTPQRVAAASGRDLTEQHRVTTALAVAGIVGPLLFTVTFLVQDLLRRPAYDPIGEPVSALGAGPSGWVQGANFVVFGLLTIAFALGLHRGVKPSRAGVLAPAIMAVTGVAMILNGTVFPYTQDAAGVRDAPVGHIVFGVTYFLGTAVWLIVVARRMAHDPSWRDLSTHVLVAGVTAIVAFVASAALVQPDDAPLHDWAGLVQRVLVIGVTFPAMVVLGLRLLRLASRDRRSAR